MTDPLDLIERKESGGRNIFQSLVPRSVSSASGNFQMVKGTWRRWAKGAGIDISKYPEAIDAPYDIQRQVAAYGYNKEGFAPWTAVKHLIGREKEFDRPSAVAQGPPVPSGGPAPAGVASSPELVPERFRSAPVPTPVASPAPPPASSPELVPDRLKAPGILNAAGPPPPAPLGAVGPQGPGLLAGGPPGGLNPVPLADSDDLPAGPSSEVMNAMNRASPAALASAPPPNADAAIGMAPPNLPPVKPLQTADFAPSLPPLPEGLKNRVAMAMAAPPKPTPPVPITAQPPPPLAGTGREQGPGSVPAPRPQPLLAQNAASPSVPAPAPAPAPASDITTAAPTATPDASSGFLGALGNIGGAISKATAPPPPSPPVPPSSAPLGPPPAQQANAADLMAQLLASKKRPASSTIDIPPILRQLLGGGNVG